MHNYFLSFLFISFACILEASTNAGECKIAGCNNELCMSSTESPFSTCLWKAEFACYQKYGICGVGPGGVCEWQMGPELASCLQSMRKAVDAADRFSD